MFLYSVQADQEEAKTNEDGDDDDSSSEADRIPFLQRLASLFSREAVRGQLKVFLTGSNDVDSGNDVLSCNEEDVPCLRRRITTTDLDKATLGDGHHSLDNVYVYVCGVPTMTDVYVEYLTGKDGPGLSTQQVLCEKWW